MFQALHPAISFLSLFLEHHFFSLIAFYFNLTIIFLVPLTMFLNEAAASLNNLGDLLSNRIEAHFPFGSQKSTANWKGNFGKLQGLQQQGPVLQFSQAIHRYCTLWRIQSISKWGSRGVVSNLPEYCITFMIGDILSVPSQVHPYNMFCSAPPPSKDTGLEPPAPQP